MKSRSTDNQHGADEIGLLDGGGGGEIDGRPHEEHAQSGGDLTAEHGIDRDGKGVTNLGHDEIKKTCQKLPEHRAMFAPHLSYRRKGLDILMTFRRSTGCVMGR